MRTSPLHGEFEQLLLACSEGCGLHHNNIGSKFGAAFICACTLYYDRTCTEHAVTGNLGNLANKRRALGSRMRINLKLAAAVPR